MTGRRKAQVLGSFFSYENFGLFSHPPNPPAVEPKTSFGLPLPGLGISSPLAAPPTQLGDTTVIRFTPLGPGNNRTYRDSRVGLDLVLVQASSLVLYHTLLDRLRGYGVGVVLGPSLTYPSFHCKAWAPLPNTPPNAQASEWLPCSHFRFLDVFSPKHRRLVLESDLCTKGFLRSIVRYMCSTALIGFLVCLPLSHTRVHRVVSAGRGVAVLPAHRPTAAKISAINLRQIS